jgi:NAD(P)-dependent dehydrogenase (short-subunit alcohol dehydrogenase family)
MSTNNSLRLEGKIVAITGGCGDIAQATAQRLTDEGATVCLLDVVGTDGLSPDLKARLEAGRVEYYNCNVADRESMEWAFEQILKGHGKLDVAIANAGIVANQPFLEIEFDKLKATMDVNFFGAFHAAQIAARVMVKQEPSDRGVRGKILFTGSWVQDMPWPEGTSYGVSKSAVKRMATSIAQELAPLGVRVNILSPGIVMAGLSKQIYLRDPQFRERVGEAIPLGQMQSAESVADAFLFLCSSDSDYMTGSNLLVDGGCTLVKRN